MINCLSIVETDKVNHAIETDIMKLVVKIKSFGMSSDEFDKETGLFDGLQPKQADLSCVHALNELHLHEIHVVPSKHEDDQLANTSVAEVGTADNTDHIMAKHNQVGYRIHVVEYYKLQPCAQKLLSTYPNDTTAYTPSSQ
ncbi:hypothetical protein Tco_0591859 [Tanacetum coccineum]